MCERWCVEKGCMTKWCVKDGVWKMVCDGVWKMVCVKDVVSFELGWDELSFELGWVELSEWDKAPGWETYVCVWTIWKDGKTSFVSMMVVFRGFRFWIILAGGSGRSFGTATNEDTHLIWWYKLGRQSAYLHQFLFPSMATGQAKNRHVDLFSSSFLHSCHNLPILRFVWLTKLHQNLPQSKDVESLFRAEIHVRSTNFPGSF